jgi:hypothetical protein
VWVHKRAHTQGVAEKPQLGTTWRRDVTQQKVSAYAKRFGKGIQTEHNMP